MNKPTRDRAAVPRAPAAGRRAAQRRGADRAARLRTPDLAAALAAAGAVIIVTDPRRLITWVNAAFTALSGYTLQQARGRSPGALLQFDGSDADTVAAMRRALRAGQGYRGRVQNRAKGGRIYWLDLDIRPTFDSRGRASGYVAVGTDVTDQVQADDYLRGIVDGAVAGLVVVDATGVIAGSTPKRCACSVCARPTSSAATSPTRAGGCCARTASCCPTTSTRCCR